jgi:hypothetical protein
VVTHPIPGRAHFPEGRRLAVDLALEAQLVCELGMSVTAAKLAHGTIDTLQFKLVK